MDPQVKLLPSWKISVPDAAMALCIDTRDKILYVGQLSGALDRLNLCTQAALPRSPMLHGDGIWCIHKTGGDLYLGCIGGSISQVDAVELLKRNSYQIVDSALWYVYFRVAGDNVVISSLSNISVWSFPSFEEIISWNVVPSDRTSLCVSNKYLCCVINDNTPNHSHDSHTLFSASLSDLKPRKLLPLRNQVCSHAVTSGDLAILVLQRKVKVIDLEVSSHFLCSRLAEVYCWS